MLIFSLDNANAIAPFGVIGSYIIMINWLFYNLFVVVLVDMFIRCLVDSGVEIEDDHVKRFQQLWMHGQCDAMGEFHGELFTGGFLCL